MAIIDSDEHLFETRTLWADHADPGDRDVALRIADDELGHAWLMFGDRRLNIAEIHHPGDVDKMGEYRNRVRAGLPPVVHYDDALPAHFWDPSARRDKLDEQGVDQTVLFPNYGLLWERPLAGDLRATKVNMTSWNRWVVAVAQEGRGRLHPVAHVTLRDLDWLDAELARLSSAGVRLAMTAPALVDGKPLSHPDLDRAWSLFEHHGVTPVFHVANFELPFHEPWYDDDDPLAVGPVMSSIFLWAPPAIALADMAVNGVFARHPDLRVGVMELSAGWIPDFLLHLDGGFAFNARFAGQPITQLDLPPSEYIRRHVRVAAFGYERPDVLIKRAGDLFLFCSDYPHAEGVRRPYEDYRAAHRPVEGEAEERLFGGNMAWLLRQDAAA